MAEIWQLVYSQRPDLNKGILCFQMCLIVKMNYFKANFFKMFKFSILLIYLIGGTVGVFNIGLDTPASFKIFSKIFQIK